MGDSKIKYLRFRYTGTLDDLNAIKDQIEEIMREEGWKRGFSEMAPLETNPDDICRAPAGALQIS